MTEVSMETVLASLFVLLATVATSTPDLDHACVFSDFLQTPGAWERWMYNLSEAGALSPDTRVHYIHVHKGLMRARIDGSVRYNRSCVRSMGNHTFLVAYQMEGTNKTWQVKYSCMHFISRSRAVVSVMKSEESDTDSPKLCAELLKDNRPWVMYAANYYEDCPVLGGFNMQLYDGMGQKKCHTLYETPRMEAGCSDEETATIDFNFRNCKISRLIYEMKGGSWQSTYCTGTWTDGPYTFTILTRKDLASYWCLRYPTDHNDSLDAYLFSEVVAETNDIIRESRQFARLALRRRVVGSLCQDASPSCETESYPWTCDNSMGEIYCKKNCSSCVPQVKPCDIFNDSIGSWTPVSEQPLSSFTIGPVNTTLSPLGNVQCISNENHYSPKTNLVRYQENGCFPRLYCFLVKPISPSLSVFQMLRGPVWPEYSSLSMTCSDNSYDLENRKFRYFLNYWMPALSAEKQMISVDCNIPAVMYEFSAELQDKTTCSGRLYKPDCPTPRNDTLAIQYETCSNTSYVGEFHYTCLGEVPVDEVYGRYIVVKDTSGIFHCFYFNRDMYYLKILPADKCFETAKYQYRLARLNLRERDIDPCMTTSSPTRDVTSVSVTVGNEDDLDTNSTARGRHSNEQTYEHVSKGHICYLSSISMFVCIITLCVLL